MSIITHVPAMSTMKQSVKQRDLGYAVGVPAMTGTCNSIADYESSCLSNIPDDKMKTSC